MLYIIKKMACALIKLIFVYAHVNASYTCSSELNYSQIINFHRGLFQTDCIGTSRSLQEFSVSFRNSISSKTGITRSVTSGYGFALALSQICVYIGWLLASSAEQIESGPGPSLCFHFAITVGSDLTRDLHILNASVPWHSSVSCGTPTKLCTISEVQDLLMRANASSVCIGNPDLHFTEMVQGRKGVIMNRTGVCILIQKHYIYTFPIIFRDNPYSNPTC